ncbi:DGQHR domain-containing protein [Sphingomonas sp. Leaf10]|uniref:DGQHR domain-containing protein n=1 Tax=Sphingomonas sp. Leaf10 TaxID=1735676 RepID=UPI000AE45CF0|nr:DGQHR domain-containing protein [Sphingomonas sp. Leaf10]
MAKYPFIEVIQQRRSFILTALPARHLTEIAYAAVRHQDEEEGAVQRVLNQSRIAGVKSFAEQGGDFPASIVLNWVKGPLERQTENTVSIPRTARSAQIIDGQHRVAGLLEAIADKPDLANNKIPVAIYESLDTVQCANIFLSINTEQRPVPKSLVFDLYGVASEDLVDEAAVRARDVVLSLADTDQAYSGLIKLPNSRRQKGGIALSTAVSAIKPLVAEKGTLEQVGASSLELQKAIFQNFFNALADKYGERWSERDNAFLYAAGFVGAIDFLNLKLIPYCNLKQSFKIIDIAQSLHLEHGNLIKQEEVKGLGGKDAPKRVYERLVSAFNPNDVGSTKFAI